MAVCVQGSEVAFTTCQPGGLSQAELDALCCFEEGMTSDSCAAPKVLGQEDLDKLCEGCAQSENTEDPAVQESLETLLSRSRRTRCFLGAEAADAFIKDTLKEQSGRGFTAGGLSQEELDALNNSNLDECEVPTVPEKSEDFMLRVRRRRHFMGAEAADALIMEAKTSRQTSKESSDETATTASDGRVSHEENDPLHTSDGERPTPASSRRASGVASVADADGELARATGLSQEELDALVGGLDGGASEEESSTESAEDYFVNVRRRRHFVGAEAAEALILDTMSSREVPAGGLSQEELDALCVTAGDEPEAMDTMLYQVRRVRNGMAPKPTTGLSQEELDALAVHSEETSEPSDSSEAFLLRVRRTRHFMGDEAADALMSKAKSKEETTSFDSKDGEAASTTSGSQSLAALSDGKVPDNTELASPKEAPCVAESTKVATDASSKAPGLSQAELDALAISEQTEESPKEPSTGRVSWRDGKASGLSIETDTEIASVLDRVCTPQRKRRGGHFSSPANSKHGSPVGSPKHAASPTVSPKHASTADLLSLRAGL